ncbi:hypothetical protein ATZ99_15420 [Thermovenabulum gondwanense]|uniref:Pyridoxamine 5'-phosphate oxidase N-terminal domain-containing protein n=1 Tax=Thermovenabulum gondwanense TaxID=520767 RepID=A0A162MET3_9FIRM|nr:pyridoxamine 5'-phosphate oxidase family protein [Thermovenabulum gondwanense]KYO65506.1 hypothetical protein ATZ99_15420 [Thermovenabulum gondwanense]
MSSEIKEVLEFLKENPTFYIATVEGDKPRVRPFGFVMEHEGKLYFCTNNQKNVYKQLKEKPYFEICTADKEGRWIRLRGKAVFNSTREIKEKALEIAPYLKTMYSADDNLFELFYVEDGEVTFCSMTGDNRTLKL